MAATAARLVRIPPDRTYSLETERRVAKRVSWSLYDWLQHVRDNHNALAADVAALAAVQFWESAGSGSIRTNASVTSKVGIRTASPQRVLHVKDTDPYIRWESSDNYVWEAGHGLNSSHDHIFAIIEDGVGPRLAFYPSRSGSNLFDSSFQVYNQADSDAVLYLTPTYANRASAINMRETISGYSIINAYNTALGQYDWYLGGGGLGAGQFGIWLGSALTARLKLTTTDAYIHDLPTSSGSVGIVEQDSGDKLMLNATTVGDLSAGIAAVETALGDYAPLICDVGGDIGETTVCGALQTLQAMVATLTGRVNEIRDFLNGDPWPTSGLNFCQTVSACYGGDLCAYLFLNCGV